MCQFFYSDKSIRILFFTIIQFIIFIIYPVTSHCHTHADNFCPKEHSDLARFLNKGTKIDNINVVTENDLKSVYESLIKFSKIGKDSKIHTVVLDAGHGGHDHGCSGSSSKEKNNALNIVLDLGRLIEKQFPNMEVIYTRKTDVFIELHERAAIANRHKADLFISVHCNYIPKKSTVKGTETYVMGLHRTKDNLNVALRENASIYKEANYEVNYGGYNPKSPEAFIFMSMYQNVYMDKSIRLATHIERHFGNTAKRYSRGVKQAGFLVLRQTAMPSVLVETGYLSNDDEDALLGSDEGQAKIANSIFRAFCDYKKEIESVGAPDLVADVKTNEPDKTSAIGSPEVKDTDISTADLVVSDKKETEPIVSNEIASTDNSLFYASSKEPSTFSNRTGARSAGNDEPVVKKSTPAKNHTGNENTKAKETNSPAKNEKPQFFIQLGTHTTKSEAKKPTYKSIRNLTFKQESGEYKYLAGAYDTYNEAAKAKEKVQSQGFKDAFIVAYQGAKKISVAEAKGK